MTINGQAGATDFFRISTMFDIPPVTCLPSEQADKNSFYKISQLLKLLQETGTLCSSFANTAFLHQYF
jgi:hypothetical protein